MLYIPGDSWNCPQWQAPCLLLSILFAKQQLECSLQHWNGKAITVVDKRQALRRGPRVGSFLLQALNELRMQPQEQQTARSIVVSLLSHCHDLLGSQAQTSSRSQALFEAIRQYMDIHYAEPLSRESVAQAFYLSPNYLSHLFQKCGPMGFNEYLNQYSSRTGPYAAEGPRYESERHRPRLRLRRQQLLLPPVPQNYGTLAV
ncbi:AraC family transcriptional regulator [Klebsiella pneumoniae]|uniref:AraC family transcriptional regulator n=1 Tax=Klebsiella pneumoniae TaxID=573 RepID=A0A2X3CU20_KLEPN|nr:AraC family transcriptional regulator [Klebsiella pneumoniae]